MVELRLTGDCLSCVVVVRKHHPHFNDTGLGYPVWERR